MALGKQVAIFCLFRLMLPLALFGAAIVRYNGFSLIYGCLLLVAPLLTRPSPLTMKGHTGRYLIAVIILCSAMLLAQIAFQGYLLASATETEPYGTILPNCSMIERSLRQLGLQRLEPNDFGNILRIVLPDIGMFIVALIVFIVCRKVCPSPDGHLQHEISQVRQRIYYHTTSFINFMGEFMVALFLAASGIAAPSVLSAVYFLSFLAIATWWACYQRLGRKFAVIRIVLLIYSASHLILEYLYQMQFFQEPVSPDTPEDSLIARVLGLNSIVYTDCRKPWLLQFNQNAKWYMIASPIVILLLYFVLACETRRWMIRVSIQPGTEKTAVYLPRTSSPVRTRSRESARDGEDEALVAHGDVSAIGQNYQSLADADTGSLAPDGYGGLAVSGLDHVGRAIRRNSLIGVRSPLVSIFVYAMKQSYVATLILMMVWSITYHSWLTFVYLLAACIIWMIPSKRHVSLMVSPLIVCYTEALLTINYIYGLNLTDLELPVETDSGFKLEEIGLIKYDYPCLQLGIQMAFTVAFWLTLRQHMREVHIRKQDFYMQGLTLEQVVPADMPSTSQASPQDETHPARPAERLRAEDLVDGFDSENIKKLGRWMWHMCYKYWIFVCGAMFLVMAIQDAVIYRIVYMVLFLYFVISFQLFYKWWRISIYVFWWIVIVYSMVVLCLIYTYQFDQIEAYWNTTGISQGVLSDLGLQQFTTGTLFAKLLTPTSFLIVVILQVHYFQRPFNKLSDIYALVYRAENEGGAVEYSDTPGDAPAEARGERPNSIAINTSDNENDDVIDDADDRPLSGGSKPSKSKSRESLAKSREKVSRSREIVSEEQPLSPESSERPRSGLYQDASGQHVTHDTLASQAEGRSTSWKERIVLLLKRGYKTGELVLNRFSALIWRLLEIHIFKVVCFTIFFVSLQEVGAINVVFVLLLVLGIPIPPLRKLMSHLCQIWCCMIIMAKMVYQLKLVQEQELLNNCTHVRNRPANSTVPDPWDEQINNAEWVGLHKTDNLANYLMNYIIISVLLAFEGIIKVHQEQYFKPANRKRPLTGIVYPEITRDEADKNLLQCVKFFLNYTFYKFGLEICFIMTMVTMVVRLDAYSVIYGVFLGILLPLRRKRCYYVWPVYIFILILLLCVQYLDCLGVPPGACWDYPWNQLEPFTSNLKIYLYLPDFQDPPDPHKLFADFFQLLFVCLQMSVLRLENSQEGHDYGGGENEGEPSPEIDPRDSPSDFLACKDSYLDYIKTGIFLYMYWVTLIIVFMAGTSRISLFCMGYLVGCFFFLWFGQELLVKPLKNLLRLWGILLGYNFFVILSKSCLQLVGCVYLSDVSEKICWIVQLLSIVCLRAGNYEQDEIREQDCNLDEDEAGLTWDAICFVFLLLQLRIYKSHYFQHVVNELEIQNKLSARGAELINTNLIRRVEQQKVRESEVLDNIKRKMERIKERQARLNQNLNLTRDLTLHYHVIRSGDYYMFEDDSDEDTESIDQVDKPEPSQDEHSDDEPVSKVDVVQLIQTVFKDGTKEALHVAEKQLVDRKSRASHSESESETGSRRNSVRLSVDMDSPIKDALSPVSPTSPRRKIVSGEFSEAAKSELAAITEDREKEEEKPAKKQVKVKAVHDTDIIQLETALMEHVGENDESDHDDHDDHDEHDEGKEGVCTKITDSMKLLWTVIGGFIDYLIGVLHDISREYRSVSRILDREKEAEKKRMRDGLEKRAHGSFRRSRVSRSGDPEPVPTLLAPALLAPTSLTPPTVSTAPTAARVHRRQKTPTEIILDIDNTQRDQFDQSINALRSAEKEFHSKMPRLLQLCIALFDALMSRSEIVCYFAMILNHMVSASLLSLPYPLSVFLWAMLSVPRPTKTYWVTIITYTEAVVVVKYLFQFGFFPWNDGSYNDAPFWPPRIIGIEKKINYAVFDLILLFCLFIHRTVLKRHGLWKDAGDIELDMAKAERDIASRPVSPARTPISSQYHDSEETAVVTLRESIETEATGLTDTQTDIVISESNQVKKKRKRKNTFGVCLSCFKPFNNFYKQMTNPKYNAVTDVYSPMFLCDFVAFIVIVFGYTSFGPAESAGGAETVQSVIQNNKVPVPFLIMLLASFVLFIVDRAIFLRKNVLGKFFFQILLVGVVHAWMFFVLPAVTDRKFSDNKAAQIWYFVKCIYFGLSAYQIRSGYPTRILGNFLTKKYNYTNLFLFKGFLVIPFLLELRALMDWMWTDTTLAITSWLQMEDIYANIFILKCWRRAEEDYHFPRGTPRDAMIKYGMGGVLLLILIFIIWFPLLLFSLANTVEQADPPVVCMLNIKLGGFQPLFSMSAQQNNLQPIGTNNYTRFRDLYAKNSAASAFLSSYKDEDIYIAEIPGESTSVWGISPPSEHELYSSLMGNDTINLVVTVTFTREQTQETNSAETVSNEFVKVLTREKDGRIRTDMANMINNGNNTAPVTIPDVFPRYLRVPGSGKVEKVEHFNETMVNVTFDLQKLNDSSHKQWWELLEHAHSDVFDTTSVVITINHLTLISFNDRVAPGALSFFTSYGIIGLYLSFILVIGQFIRLLTSGLAHNIMFTHLPYVDRVLKICKDLYLVREAKELRLEEELFARLVFLYRSPETLIKVTRHPATKEKED